MIALCVTLCYACSKEDEPKVEGKGSVFLDGKNYLVKFGMLYNLNSEFSYLFSFKNYYRVGENLITDSNDYSIMLIEFKTPSNSIISSGDELRIPPDSYSIDFYSYKDSLISENYIAGLGGELYLDDFEDVPDLIITLHDDIYTVQVENYPCRFIIHRDGEILLRETKPISFTWRGKVELDTGE